MLMPKFYRPISYRSDGMRTWESYHCDWYRLCIREYELDFLKLPPPSPILGQPNPETLHQRDCIRPVVEVFVCSPARTTAISSASFHVWRTNVSGPVSKAMQHEDGSRLLFECWDYKGLPTCHGGDRAYE
jgi:hypothetical protein